MFRMALTRRAFLFPLYHWLQLCPSQVFLHQPQRKSLGLLLLSLSCCHRSEKVGVVLGPTRSVRSLVPGTKQQDVQASAVFCFPGNLSVSRRETYSGEDLFEGPIHYAMCDNVDYSICEGQEVAVIGHGAFAVENVRTCCEFAAKKVWLICRRKNLSCPRISSWFINQSHSFISGLLM